MAPFIDTLNTFNGVSARVVWDSAGRDIARTEIKFDEAVTGIATGDLVDALKQGEYAIYFRGYKANEGIIEADVRSVDRAQLAIVARRIGEVINQRKSMKLTPNFYRDRVCLNVLAGSKDNAREIYAAAEGHVLVGVLSKTIRMWQAQSRICVNMRRLSTMRSPSDWGQAILTSRRW